MHFTSIDAEMGKRRWQRGRYFFGRVILREQQELLLVATEAAEVVLLNACPEKHEELARFTALSGKA